MRFIRLLFVALLLVPPTHAFEPLDAVLPEARAAEARFDSRAALDFYLQANASKPDDPAILQKISRQYSDLVDDASDAAERKHLCTEALAYAQRTVALDPKNAVNVLSLAIAYGKLALESDLRTKIDYSRFVRQYAEEALALDPDYAYAHHVLGRWHYEVANLSGTKRFLARLIYGSLPPASNAEAVNHLRRAVELAPESPSHRIELGFALLAAGQRDEARKTFEAALQLSPREKPDADSLRRAREALTRLDESR